MFLQGWFMFQQPVKCWTSETLLVTHHTKYESHARLMCTSSRETVWWTKSTKNVVRIYDVNWCINFPYSRKVSCLIQTFVEQMCYKMVTLGVKACTSQHNSVRPISQFLFRRGCMGSGHKTTHLYSSSVVHMICDVVSCDVTWCLVMPWNLLCPVFPRQTSERPSTFCNNCSQTTGATV